MQINVSGNLTCTDVATASTLGTLAVSGVLDVAAPPAPSPGPTPVPPPSGPSWIEPVAVQNFDENVSKTVDMKPAISGFDPTKYVFVIQATPGFTADPTGLLQWDGTGPVQSGSIPANIIDKAPSPGPSPGPSPSPTPPDVLADFQARRDTSQAFFAENWGGYADAAAAYNAPARAYANKTPAGALFPNAFELITTPGHVLSGKALRLWHGKNNYGAAGDIDNQAWGVMCNGNRNNIPGAYKTKLYFQCCIWVDAYIDYFWRLGDGSAGTTKFFIIDDWDKTSSAGEFVVDNQYNRQFLHCYRKVPSGGSPDVVRHIATPVNNDNYLWQNAIDNKTPLTDQGSYERCYGPMAYGMTGGNSQASKLSTQGVPDPDAAIGGVALKRGGITVIEVMLDLAADRAKVWAAHHGQAPKLINDTVMDNNTGGKALLGTRVGSQGTGWSAVTLSNLVYTASGAQNPNYPTDAFTDYVELIFAPNPINFPGGYTLP